MHSAWWWYLVCAALVLGMGYLRFVVYNEEFIPLTYALPLLVCLWNRSVRLLWGMTALFFAMVAAKFVLAMPDAAFSYKGPWVYGIMQLANIGIAAAVIHSVIRLTGTLEHTVTQLERTNAELEASNEELAAREEEISRQNEELQMQAEELEQQTEELNAQTEELQTVNEQLAARERSLSDLLETSTTSAGETETLARIGETVERLLGHRAVAAAVLEPQGADMRVRPLFGMNDETQRIRRTRTFADLIMQSDRAGFLPDTRDRADLEPPRLRSGERPRSVAAAPMRVEDHISAVLEVYSDEPSDWSEHELRVTQWLADQCGRMWTTARLREELDVQRRLLATVTGASSVALFLLDESGTCTYLNPAAQHLTGYALKDLQNAPLHAVIRAPDASGARLPFGLGAVGASDPTALDAIIRKDGERVPVQINATPIDRNGEPAGCVVEVRDATAQFRHEQEREQLLASERAARADAERANRAKDEFVATLSHELRTPLTAVLGWASLLRKNDCSNIEETRRGVEVIERNARSQSQLISDLLDISRITAGKIRLDVQTVDLPLIIESALDSVRLAAEAKGVRLERLIETIDRAVTGDPNRLQQVIWNLLTNAIRHTPRDGRVQVIVSRVASYVQITVSDTGEGIDPDLLPSLFERFRQEGATAKRHGGLGLGLAIAKHLVELHGGSIHARSDGKGKGASFSVLLPVRAAEVHAAAEGPHPRTPTAGEKSPETPKLGEISVLVVEDEEDARHLISHILRDHGAVVKACASGDEALQALAASQPDLIVSDLGMPGMDGYTFMREVRKRWPNSSRTMPAIALTAFARSEDRTRALLAGFQSHIAKPVEAAELLATIYSLSQRMEAGKAQQEELNKN